MSHSPASLEMGQQKARCTGFHDPRGLGHRPAKLMLSELNRLIGDNTGRKIPGL